MRRHDLRFRHLHGEAASVDPTVVLNGLRDQQELLDAYEPGAVHNMDETGLCHSMMPSRGICSRRMKGVKIDKTRVTVGLTANATDTSQLPPLFIGRARRPRCFGRKPGQQLGFDYFNNAKAWMPGLC